MSGRKGKQDEEDDPVQKEQYVAKNWGFFKRDERKLKKGAPTLHSKYMAYEPPVKEVADAQTSCKKRLAEKNRRQNRFQQIQQDEDEEEREKHELLIGQLKAAEARNRIRTMRVRYEANKNQEINHLIACQPSATKAVRLQAFFPSSGEDRTKGDPLDKLTRGRVESLLEDTQGLMTNRT